MNRDNIIEIEGLCKSYGSVQAVKDVSFTVKRGSTFSFLGINGAGKSTTINIICSILAKDSGKVFVDGCDLDTKAQTLKQKIGIVFQNSVLDELLSVKDNLTARAALYGLSGAKLKSRLDEVCSLLNLSEIWKRPFGKLSGGQKRRADIARGLLNKPKLLILDEPTTGLDPQTRKSVWRIIDNLRQNDGMTVFLTTHYMEEADSSDNVVIIDGGKVTAQGSPVELKNLYSGNYLYLYGDAAKLADKIKADGLTYETLSGGIKIRMKDAAQAASFIAENKKAVSDFEFIKGNMDDVFLNVTGKKLSIEEQ